jgi:cation diffusion facilitator family transporter
MMRTQLKYPILLSIAAALATMALKWTAYLLTGSVGLLSDAAESLVNLFTAVIAFFSLWYASRPVDPEHTYGHEKIEYFSGGIEGVVVLAAGAGLAWYAFLRLWTPTPLEAPEWGVGIALAASLINWIAARVLLRQGKAHDSLTLEADGQHLMTDVWTSLAVVLGVALVWLTQVLWLDPLVGLLASAKVAWTGLNLIRVAFNGLMDHALPVEEQAAVRAAIESRLRPGMDYHALRTRQAGPRRFVDFHLLVPGNITVRRSHEITAEVEQAVRSVLPRIEITVHIEPIEDRTSWEDSALLPIEQAAREAAHREEPTDGSSAT